MTCQESGGGADYVGLFSIYPCGGHTIFDFKYDSTLNSSLKISKDMKVNNFYDRKTSLILVEFFLFNNNLNYITQVRFATEFTKGGAALPSFEFFSFKPEPFREPGDIVYFSFSILIVFYIFYFVFDFAIDVTIGFFKI
jgi:hypothetical protein